MAPDAHGSSNRAPRPEARAYAASQDSEQHESCMEAGVKGRPHTLQVRVTNPAACADLPAQLREQNRRRGRAEGKGRPQ
ncbi:conserved hypothetical protein [Nitratidesulfovibrio vulgaris DP4]|uniref:Uncharacterized protein n=1 Tax=Nitratidesulfovibrio vulgaris (strain DP4) TaxID=391774 RepID=A0A0H3A6E5_NITV4|nr:conserved hypothetical protein [Nitratidesulfovibrio vulgaris DP4]